MARKCALTGKRPLSGNKVSHAHNTTRTKQLPNVHIKKIFVPEIQRNVKVKLSASALRTVNKIGLLPYVRKLGLSLKEISR